MTPEVSVFVGPPRSGKTCRLLGQYRQSLRRAASPVAVDRALWLAPTARNAAGIRRSLLADGVEACLSPGVMTFDGFARRVLASSRRLLRPLSASLQRELLARLVRSALENGELNALAPSAPRPGLVDLLADHIGELQRRNIDPEVYAKAAAARGDSPQQAELSRLYAEYDRLARSAALCDQEGRQSAARDAIEGDECPWPRDLDLVVVDGFADFTPLQRDILRLLALRAARLAISLPGEGPTGDDQTPLDNRDDLFAKSQATLAEIRRHFPNATVVRMPWRASGWPALDHLVRHLFRNPRQCPAPAPDVRESLDRLEIVEAAGAHDEIVEVARRIKQQLIAGQARPGDILVVFRSLGDVAHRVREVFSELGIPHLLESGQPLLRANFLRTLLSLFRLDLENWPYRRVVAVVTNRALAHVDDGSHTLADWLVRDLQIAEGLDVLVERVRQLAAEAVSSPPDGMAPSGHDDGAPESTHQKRTAAAVATLPILEQIAAALAELPQVATHTEWAAALERLAARLGFAPLPDSSSAPGQPAAPGIATSWEDHVAWQRIADHLTSLGRLADWLGESPPTLSRSDMLRVLVDLATHESLPPPHDEVGRVRVLSAATARTVSARHVFLAGMSEQAFPSPERVGQLASEADYQFVSRAANEQRGECTPAAVERSQEEMLLFYEVLTRASERLTISYPALDDRAQSLPPSPYVTEVERVVERAQEIRRAGPHLSPIPAENGPLGPTDWRISAVHQALSGEHGLLAGLMASGGDTSLAGAAEAGLRIVDARRRGSSFGPAEGLLTGPVARDRLAQQFGPLHLWSPSQWEQYAQCPHRFFLQHVLRLVPLGELALEIDHRRRGSRLHRVLAAFHRRLREVFGTLQVPSQRDESQFLAEFRQAVADTLEIGSFSGLDAALQELDRRQIERWAEGYFEQHVEYDQAWSDLEQPPVPTHFEVRFGPPRPGATDAEDPQSTSQPFVLDIGDEQIRITGRIDRIDVGHAGGQTVFNVIDYKSGKRPSATSEQIQSGQRLQLPLYVMAAQQVLLADDHATPLWTGYWSMKNGLSMKGSLRLHEPSHDRIEPTQQWTDLQPQIVQRVAEFVRAIRGGEFPVFSCDEHCTRNCEFSTVCRVAQARSLGKAWPPEDGASAPADGALEVATDSPAPSPQP